MNEVLMIRVASVYGKTTIYPDNEPAEILAEIAGTKTLTMSTLALAEKMGFSIMEVGTTYTKYGVSPG